MKPIKSHVALLDIGNIFGGVAERKNAHDTIRDNGETTRRTENQRVGIKPKDYNRGSVLEILQKKEYLTQYLKHRSFIT